MSRIKLFRFKPGDVVFIPHAYPRQELAAQQIMLHLIARARHSHSVLTNLPLKDYLQGCTSLQPLDVFSELVQNPQKYQASFISDAYAYVPSYTISIRLEKVMWFYLNMLRKVGAYTVLKSPKYDNLSRYVRDQVNVVLRGVDCESFTSVEKLVLKRRTRWMVNPDTGKREREYYYTFVPVARVELHKPNRYNNYLDANKMRDWINDEWLRKQLR